MSIEEREAQFKKEQEALIKAFKEGRTEGADCGDGV